MTQKSTFNARGRSCCSFFVTVFACRRFFLKFFFLFLFFSLHFEGGADIPAQKEIVRLRELGAPDLCLRVARSVLENQTATLYAKFNALSLLESAVLRQPQASLVVLRYMLERSFATYAVQDRALTKKMLHVCAVIYKRSFQPAVVAEVRQVEASPNEFRDLVLSEELDEFGDLGGQTSRCRAHQARVECLCGGMSKFRSQRGLPF